MSTEIEVYKRIISRWDVWAQQATRPDEKGRYGYFTKKIKLTESDIYDSVLSEKKTIGAYIVNPLNNTCTNPQIDIDNHDGATDVIGEVGKVFAELGRIGLYPYIEASSGELKQGAHIGTICKPTSAKICKSVLDDVLKTLNLSGHEVFPKQTEVNPDSFGNLVKLPFQFNNRTKARSQIINPETMHPFEKQDAINYLMALPDSVFSDTPPVDNKTAAIKKGNYFHDIFQLENIKPCIAKAYDDKLNLHGKGDAGHDFHLAIAGNLLYNGATDEQVHEFFKIQPDYSPDTTTKQLQTIKTYLATGRKPTGCKKLIEKCNIFLNGLCETCKNKPKEKTKKTITASNNQTEQFPHTDLGNAKRFAVMQQEKVRYIPLWKTWVSWDGKCWRMKEDRMLVPLVDEMIQDMHAEAERGEGNTDREKCHKHATATESENHIMATIRLSQSMPGMQAHPDEFTKDRYLLNFQNGTLNLKTKELQPHNRDDRIMRICTGNYDPTEKSPLWLDFLEKVFSRDKEIITYIQKLFGMALTGDVSEEVFHVLYGGGSNGKTTLMTTFEKILGYEYFKIVGVEILLKRGQKAIANDVARLQGARVVWANEPEFDDQITEGKLKKLVSKERILGELKYKEPIEFDPEYAGFLSCNNRPIIRGVDDGLRRRVRLIPFNHKFEGTEKDIHFAEKLIDEFEGIINWAIDGCVAWQRDGLIPPEQILEATSNYHQDMDRLADLFNLFFVKEPQARTPHILLYTAYKLWAQINEVLIMSERGFSSMMNSRGFETIRARFPDGRQFRGFSGVSLEGYNYNSDELLQNKHELLQNKHDFSNTLSSSGNEGKTEIQKALSSSGNRPYPENTINSSGNNPSPDGSESCDTSGRLCDRSLFTCVTDFLKAPEHEKTDKKLICDTYIKKRQNPFSSDIHAHTDINVTSVTSVTNDMQSNNAIFSQSVTSVTSVTNNKDITIKLKQKYDKLNKPESIQDLEHLKVIMERTILNEMDGFEEYDIMRVVDNYCHARQWC